MASVLPGPREQVSEDRQTLFAAGTPRPRTVEAAEREDLENIRTTAFELACGSLALAIYE
jgi:hypothetical protein